MNSNDRFLKLTSKLGVFFIGLIITTIFLFAVEYGYRAYKNNSPEVFDIGYLATKNIHEPKPYVMYSSKPGFQQFGPPGTIEGKINNLGYLGKLPSKVKPANEFRIFILGASAAFFGNPPFSYYLEKMFQDLHQGDVKVFNFSVIAGVSRQELIRILTDIAGYQPDLIISYTGYNDLFDTGWDPRINYPHRYILSEINPVTSRSAIDFKLLPTLALSSQVMRDFFPTEIYQALIKNVLPPTLPKRNTIRPLIAKSLIQNLRLANLLSQQLGAAYFSFIQPTVFFKANKTDLEKVLASDQDMQNAQEIRSALSTEIENIKSKFNLIDASELFASESRTVFVDAVHYVNEPWAQQAVAKFIFDAVKNSVNLKKEKSNIKNLIPEEDFVFN